MTSREKLVVQRRHAGLSFRAIGAEIGITGAQARRTYLRALRRLGKTRTWGGDW